MKFVDQIISCCLKLARMNDDVLLGKVYKMLFELHVKGKILVI